MHKPNLSFRLPADLLDELKATADLEATSPSAIAVQALSSYLRHRKGLETLTDVLDQFKQKITINNNQ